MPRMERKVLYGMAGALKDEVDQYAGVDNKKAGSY